MTYPAKGRADFLELGAFNVTCSLCGRKRKSNEVVQNWQGMYRCPEHNEPRQPQDFVRAVQDDQTVPFSQPQNTTYVAVCTPDSRSAVPGYAGPGCAMPGFVAPGNLIPFFQ